MAPSKFLERVSLEDARRLLLSRIAVQSTETIDTVDSVDRVTAEPLHAAHPAPHYRASAMDGIAVRSPDTAAATVESPVTLQTTQELPEVAAGHCQEIDTGGAMPPWADAVVRIEDTEAAKGGFAVTIPVHAGRDVRRAGEDIDVGVRILPSGVRIRPYDVGALLATGVTRVRVRVRPRVAVMATGNEVVEPTSQARPGQVIEYNSHIIAGMVAEWGGTTDYRGIVADDPDALSAALTAAANDADLVAVIAGSSAGRKDFTVEVLRELGEVFVHGVDVMPGKPASLSAIDDTAVIGIPGYPVSAIVICEQILRPALQAMLGLPVWDPPTIVATVARKIPSRLGVEEFRRVCLCLGPGGYTVAPLPHGAGAISTVARAHGWLRIGATAEGLDAGSEAKVELLQPESTVAHSIIVANAATPLTSVLEDVLSDADGACRLAHLSLSDADCPGALSASMAHIAVAKVSSVGRGAIADDTCAWTIDGGDDPHVLLLSSSARNLGCGTAVAKACDHGSLAARLGTTVTPGLPKE